MASPSLGNLIGLLEYNGVKFDALYTSEVNGEPIYDDAKRNVKMLRWVISVTARITVQAGDTTTDPYMRTLRQKLTEPGKKLVYDSKGFGPFAINDPAGTVFDVDWGPKPELLYFKPIGNNLAALINWRIVVCIPECPTAVYKKALMMLNYRVEWSIDTDGYTVITTTGAIEIPISRSGNILIDNADRYRHLAVPPVNQAFQRRQTFTLSNDRRRLEFTIVDTEMPVPLPVGCTLANVKYKVRSNVGGAAGFVKWVHTVSGTFRILPDRPRAQAFDKFFNVVAQKINSVIMSPQEPQIGGQNTTPGTKCFVLLLDLEMEEDVFGKDCSFHINFLGMGFTLATVMRVSGIFSLIQRVRPTVGQAPPAGLENDFQSFRNWQRNNERMAGHIRGNIKATYQNKADLLIDLCLTSPGPTVPINQTDDKLEFGLFGQSSNPNLPELMSPIGSRLGTQAYGEEETSWLMYDCDVQYFEDDHIVRHKPLAGTLTLPADGQDSSKLGFSAAAGQSRERFGPRTNVPDRFQRISAPSGTLKLSGRAMRVGHQIAAPRLVEVSGHKVVQAGQVIIPRQVGAIQGIPVWSLTWDITYYLTQVPTALPSIANPALCLDGHPAAVPSNEVQFQSPIRR